MMSSGLKYILLTTLIALIQCSPYDDGKYRPKKYEVSDDGKYYRPLDEGKYIPGDEGRYTYVYRQGLYPEDDGDYRYVHVVGPNGGFGGNGGNGAGGGNGGNGGFGPNGPGGPGGPGGPSGPGGPGGPDPSRKPNKIDYIGSRTYAPRYPYMHKVIDALVDEYVSEDAIFGDSSTNHYRKLFAENAIAVKCQLLQPKNQTEFVTQFPPTMQLGEREKFGSYYSFKGKKTLNTVNNALKSKVKVEYEVFVRVVDSPEN